MSNAAPDVRRSLRSERFKPELPQLRVVPRQRVQAGGLPFILLVSALLVGGVVALLMFNTSMQAASFTEARLQKQATALAARQQSLAVDLEDLRSPQRVANAAAKQGLVIPAAVAMLQIDTAAVLGQPAPADRTYTPPLWVGVVKPSFN